LNIQNDLAPVVLSDALLWQHNEATVLQGLLESKQAWLDANNQGFWENWQNDVLNLDTANDFGLAVWAIILNMPLGKSSITRDATTYFGFSGFGANFTNGNFSAQTSTTLADLSTEERRKILKLRYGQITTRCDVLGVNEMLARIFGAGVIYLLQSTDMSFTTYVSNGALSVKMLQVIAEYDLLPRPAAVGVRVVTPTPFSFGFGQYRTNFNNGNYIQ
jgi:hypothetical protein